MHQDFGNNKGLENLRKGRYTQFHLLNHREIPFLERDFMIVQFDRPTVLDKESIADHLAQQNAGLRLLPPSRERLAQACARSFMRVGLPMDICLCSGEGSFSHAGMSFNEYYGLGVECAPEPDCERRTPTVCFTPMPY